jgi:uncharacterized membrane protein YgcG
MLTDSQVAALVVISIGGVAGVVLLGWAWMRSERERREALALAARERDTVPEPRRPYVPLVNGTVRVHPGGYVPRKPNETWDLYVPPSPVRIPDIPPAPLVPRIAEYSPPVIIESGSVDGGGSEGCGDGGSGGCDGGGGGD